MKRCPAQYRKKKKKKIIDSLVCTSSLGSVDRVARLNGTFSTIGDQHLVTKSAKTLGLLKRTLYPAKPKVREAAYNMLVRPK